MGPRVLLRVDALRHPGTLDGSIRAALDDGFDGVELPLERTWASSDELTRVLQDRVFGPLAQASPNTTALAFQCSTVDLASACEEITALTRCLSRCGPACLNLALPPLASTKTSHGFHSYQDALNFAYQFFHEVRLDVEASGVLLAIESAYGRCFLSPVEIREVLDSVNSWAIGACLDLDRLSAFSDAGDWLATLHGMPRVIRIRPETGINRPALGGIKPLRSLTAALPVLESVQCTDVLIACTSV